jgi:hypothetical protein
MECWARILIVCSFGIWCLISPTVTVKSKVAFWNHMQEYGHTLEERDTILWDDVHFQPWVNEELNNLLLNMLCNAHICHKNHNMELITVLACCMQCMTID